MTNTEKAIAFISRHDVGFGAHSVADVDGDTLIVFGTAVEPSGELVTTIDRIPATLQGARDWLGY